MHDIPSTHQKQHINYTELHTDRQVCWVYIYIQSVIWSRMVNICLIKLEYRVEREKPVFNSTNKWLHIDIYSPDMNISPNIPIKSSDFFIFVATLVRVDKYLKVYSVNLPVLPGFSTCTEGIPEVCEYANRLEPRCTNEPINNNQVWRPQFHLASFDWTCYRYAAYRAQFCHINNQGVE